MPHADLSLIVKDLQEYEQQRTQIEVCGISSVQPITCIVLNGIPHSGVATHACTKSRDHTGPELCQCACGYKWLGKK